MLVCALPILMHTRPRVHRAPGIPHALWFEGGKLMASLEQKSMLRDREPVSQRHWPLKIEPDARATYSHVIVRLDRTIQYPRDASDRAERSRRTGYPAFAEYDTGVEERSPRTLRRPYTLVIAGLDPAIHQTSQKRFSQEDGSPGRAR